MKNYTLLILIIFNLLSCDNLNEGIDRITDLTPPSIKKLLAINNNTITLESNEEFFVDESSFFSSDSYTIQNITYLDNTANITFDQDFTPGKQYNSEFKIKDNNGNSLSFISNYYGFNPNIPNLIFNEFIVKGSNTNPNKIELYVETSGNTAGITIYVGTKNNFDYSFIFPALDVNKGDYIVIRTLTDNFPTPFIETDDLSVQNDSKFIDNIRDLRISDFKLSSTNGVLTLYSDPYGEIIDAVIYSKNINDSEKNNRNFGLSKMVKRVDEVGLENHWFGIYNDIIFPEDVIYIGDSTSTRSLNRNNITDNNIKNDWITVATRESTFGFHNSEVEY